MQNTALDSNFAALLESAVHDLKGPASRLRLVSQLLNRSGGLDEDTRTLLQYLEESAAAVGVVADGLRRYAEICARPLKRERVDLGLLATAARANLQQEITDSGAEVTHAALPVASADHFLMTWVFQELLSNAIRFRADAAPQVRISAAVAGPRNWYVAVTDNGPGIAPGLSERVFLPFKRLSSTGGAGVGLTICRTIVELHRGKIWIEPGQPGAEFRFFVSEEDD
jgi:light-regulated signal transduction histidine kinase (bacteriophytochrome)